MQSGLWSRVGPVPLVNVSVASKIIDFTAEITVSQTYVHTEKEAIEATFKFPLDLLGALCGFEVVLDGKRIHAQVKRREEAPHISREVKNNKENTFLLEEDLPDIFVCNIGRLAPQKQVEFKLTYVTELSLEDKSLRFVLPPSTISPNFVTQENRQNFPQQSDSSNSYNLSVSIDVSSSHGIETITSSTHSLDIPTKDESHAIVKVEKEASNEGNLVVLIGLKNLQGPRSLIEKEEESGSFAVMLSFSPIFDIEEIKGNEIIFLVDCSTSMKPLASQVKDALFAFFKSLPSETLFNVVTFGNSVEKVFDKSVPSNEENLQKANKLVEELNMDLEGTDLNSALEEIYANSPAEGKTRQLFVITDGHVSNTRDVLSLARKNAENTRLFTIGIGERVSHLLVLISF